MWATVLSSGPGAALAGLTAARLDGLQGFDEAAIHVVIPGERRSRGVSPGVVVHRSSAFTAGDIHPVRTPPRTRLPRSVVDAAAWAPTSRIARGVLAASVQQRLVRSEHLSAAMAGLPKLRRHALITATLTDITDGAQALSELDFAQLVRRHRLPPPDRQVRRTDGYGRARWLDCYWEWARLIAEIDGMWHMEAMAWWDDMRRDNDLTVRGYRVLRFPAFAVREDAQAVADQVRDALGRQSVEVAAGHQ